MPIYKKFQNDEAILTIEYDVDPRSPREDDNLGSMICWHGRYNLGDKHKFEDGNVFFLKLLKDVDRSEKTLDRMKSRDELFEFLETHYVILPVYLYDHGSLTIQTTAFSCPWDSGQVGWIFVSHKKVRKVYGVKRVNKALRLKVLNSLKSEVETYNHFLNGDVYGFVLKNLDGQKIESCWGLYGSDFYSNGLAEHIPTEYINMIEGIA
ncbi:hypothetical protein [Paenibacillus terrae]|uniref:hypothetical protein n=1 Tax=Paenibacillus terrae TaxID=159743 RepID=UPI0005CB9A16|nr:hypothetical protein [Paenibacillus terrae]